MKKSVWPIALYASLATIFCSFGSAAYAQSVPAPWSARDLGSPTLGGSTTYSGGVFAIEAAGVDIWGTADQGHFVYQAVAGDAEIVARVDSLTRTDVWANAGVMIRSSLAANSAFGYAASTSSNGVYFRRRLSNGASASSVAGPKTAAPVWVRLVRQGSRVTGYSSSNGTSWTTVASSTIPLGTTAYIGLAATSHNSGARTSVRVSNVRLTGMGLPSGQQSMDIGSPAVAGSATFASGTYTIRAAGRDIWDTADQFHFVYQTMSGNGEVVARVASIANTDAWAKAGVMIRESLTAASRHAMVVTSISKGYAFQRRPDPGGYSEHTAGGSGTAPGWVRLVRTGDLFEAYRSANGTSWTRIGSDTIPLGDTVYVGMAATSHNSGTATTAAIDSLRVTAATGTNQNPAVSITQPATGAQYTAPATVAIAATATDPEGRMASVDFYVGTTLIVRDTTAPHTASWSATSAGTYSLTAVAHDADGGSSTSGAVSVTVRTATNQPPTASLATNGTSFTAPASITLTATASDPEGQLARVEFFNGSTRLSTDTTAPYSFTWSNVAAGTYSLTAVAYDAAGASATSAARSVTVTAASTPPRLVVFTASTDHSTNVTSYLLKIFAAGANPATATPVASSSLGKPAPASNRDITVDRATFFSGLAAGNYLATVTAIGNGGQTPSASVAFTR